MHVLGGERRGGVRGERSGGVRGGEGMGEEGKLTGTELKHDGHNNGKRSDNGMNM